MNEDIIHNLFPVPVYQTYRESGLDSTEKKEIEDIVDEGMIPNLNRYYTNNSYIFDTKLKNLKEFCEQKVKSYVDEIIRPKQDLEFYITQSWLNVTKPGGAHQTHAHNNSIISGAFYIRTDIGQTITCYNIHKNCLPAIEIEQLDSPWGNASCIFPVTDGQLMLFPSWLSHGVTQNPNQTKDVISLSFNTFVRGSLGKYNELNQLILQ